MAELKLPVSEESIRNLKVGDFVELTGRMITGRDAAHKWLIEDHREEVAPYMADTVIYHCGPVVAENEDGSYDFVAAGPTTSIREEPYQADVIAHFGMRGVIGKGGMGPGTLRACQEHGAVYFHAVGGAASLIANSVKEVVAVHKKDEFGVPEAFWVIRVAAFPVIVTMDSHGRSIHVETQAASEAALDSLVYGE